MNKRLFCILFLVGGLVGCYRYQPACSTEIEGDIQHLPDPAGAVYVGSGDVYAPGALDVVKIKVTGCQLANPVPVEIYAPARDGRYAVVVFQHGFLIDATDYSTLLRHIAGHGFVVVAPQMYTPEVLPVGQPTTQEEAATAARMIDWLAEYLATVAGVEVDLRRLGIAGHSRGGRVAWLLMTEYDLPALAIAGVDPVDSGEGTFNPEPPVTGQPLDLGVPSLIIGAGQGAYPQVTGGLACAPPSANYEHFYGASGSPAWLVVGQQGGHIDMLNDHLGFNIVTTVCPFGDDRQGFRKLCAGLLTALFRAGLQGDEEAYAVLSNTESAPTAATAEMK